MNYLEADILSRTNKEFILSLYPSGVIYETLLPLEARAAIGKVGKETLPVKKMLEDVGFKYMDEVDPFDGGPHYRAKLKDITLIKNKISVNLCSQKVPNNSNMTELLLSIPDSEDGFIACKLSGHLTGNGPTKTFEVSKDKLEKMNITENILYQGIYI